MNQILKCIFIPFFPSLLAVICFISIKNRAPICTCSARSKYTRRPILHWNSIFLHLFLLCSQIIKTPPRMQLKEQKGKLSFKDQFNEILIIIHPCINDRLIILKNLSTCLSAFFQPSSLFFLHTVKHRHLHRCLVCSKCLFPCVMCVYPLYIFFSQQFQLPLKNQQYSLSRIVISQMVPMPPLLSEGAEKQHGLTQKASCELAMMSQPDC